MIKKILITTIAVLFTSLSAQADTCGKSLTGLFTAFQAKKLCGTFLGVGTSFSESLIPNADNTLDIGDATHSIRTIYLGTSRISKTSDILRVRQDANRLFTWDASSDAALTMTFGDAGTTATQIFTLSASTPDADDDSSIVIAGGGAAGATRGGSITIAGEEVLGGGDITYNTGTGDTHIFQVAGTTEAILADDKLTVSGTSFSVVPGATSFLFRNNADNATNVTITDAGDITATRSGTTQAFATITSTNGTITTNLSESAGEVAGVMGTTSNHPMNFRANGSTKWQLTTAGAWQNDATNGGDVNMSKPGTTLAVQESSAGAACSGTLTANGATPVVTNTSCATTGSRIFLSRTSAETGTVNAWKSALSNGVSFSITSEAADTGTYDWLIVHEAP